MTRQSTQQQHLPVPLPPPVVEVKDVVKMDEHLATLVGMLTYRRTAGSRGERRFIREYILPLGVKQDKIGNLSKRIPNPDGSDSNVMWSCHTDTVHRMGGKQRLLYKNGLLKAHPDSKSNCLGADDTAGCWLLRELILAKKPGLYIFHRAEERGGIGSRYLAKNTPELLKGIDIAIAVDRRGTTDVITHQGWGRCCSDAFARSLADGLKMEYKPSSHGIFTDTANYVDLIGECTNLSVGYYSEHFKDEALNVEHILRLREALFDLDVSKLVIERKPGDIERKTYKDWNSTGTHSRGPYYGQGTGYPHGWFKDPETGVWKPTRKGKEQDVDDYYSPWKPESKLTSTNDVQRAMKDMVEDHPYEVADLLEHLGYDLEGLTDALLDRGAVIKRSPYGG